MSAEQGTLIVAVAAGALLVGASVRAVWQRVRGRSLAFPDREGPRPLGELTGLHTPPTVPWRDGVVPDRDRPA